MRRFIIFVLVIGFIAGACGPPLAPSPTAPSDGVPQATTPPTDPAPGATIVASVTPIPPPTVERASIPNQEALRLLAEVDPLRLYNDVTMFAAFYSRHVNSRTIADAAEAIYATFQEAGGRWIVEYDPFVADVDEVLTTQRNVIATLPGSDPAAGVVLIGAHYDSRTYELFDADTPAPGANDNATGTAALLELARLLADHQPRATIKLVAFSGEEEGTLGSTHYVQAALARGENLRAVLVLDIVGNSIGPAGENAIRLFSAPPNESPSRQFARYVRVIGSFYQPAFTVHIQSTLDRPNRYSDHRPFSESGIPAARFIESIEDINRQHSPLDRPEHISPAYLATVTRLTLAVTLNLANGPSAPSAPYPAELEPNALTWDAPPGAAAYLVAQRMGDSLAFDAVERVESPAFIPASMQGPASVSVAAISADGWIGLFSVETQKDW